MLHWKERLGFPFFFYFTFTILVYDAQLLKVKLITSLDNFIFISSKHTHRTLRCTRSERASTLYFLMTSQFQMSAGGDFTAELFFFISILSVNTENIFSKPIPPRPREVYFLYFVVCVCFIHFNYRNNM